jgi:hypothetical protein
MMFAVLTQHSWGKCLSLLHPPGMLGRRTRRVFKRALQQREILAPLQNPRVRRNLRKTAVFGGDKAVIIAMVEEID